MKFISNHKFTIVVITIFIVGVIGLYFFYDLFFSNGGKPAYGDRLNGIESAELTDSDYSKIVSTIKNNSEVLDVSYNLSGRTLEIIITVGDNVSLSKAKEIGSSSFSKLSEIQVKYYSIQIFVKKNDSKQNNFPIIGYKQKESKNVVWTKDRKVTS